MSDNNSVVLRRKYEDAYSPECLTVLDPKGNILSLKEDNSIWKRQGSVAEEVLSLPGNKRQSLSIYQEGRLSRLLKQENYRRTQEEVSGVCRDLLQHLLLHKPENPLQEMRKYFKDMDMNAK